MEIGAGDYRVVAAPDLGGSILRFDWRGEPLLRPSAGRSILDVACFPLVPFSNRIAGGHFVVDGREVRLRPNFPGTDHPHPLHGFGWLAPWAMTAHGPAELAMTQVHSPGEWPWAYRAEQRLSLDAHGLVLGLEVTNLGDRPMPLGLGFHPYFPRNDATIYTGLHRGEWRNDAACLPLSLDERDVPRDWWDGAPVAARAMDTVYMHRQGDLAIHWPDRDLQLTLTCSEALAHTVVFAPPGEDFFCVEPVTHATNAFNRGTFDLLSPGASRTVHLRFTAKHA